MTAAVTFSSSPSWPSTTVQTGRPFHLRTLWSQHRLGDFELGFISHGLSVREVTTVPISTSQRRKLMLRVAGCA